MNCEIPKECEGDLKKLKQQQFKPKRTNNNNNYL